MLTQVSLSDSICYHPTPPWKLQLIEIPRSKLPPPFGPSLGKSKVAGEMKDRPFQFFPGAAHFYLAYDKNQEPRRNKKIVPEFSGGSAKFML